MQLTLETIREPYHEVYVPRAIAKAITAPREYIFKKVRPWTISDRSAWCLSLQIFSHKWSSAGLYPAARTYHHIIISRAMMHKICTRHELQECAQMLSRLASILV